MGGGGEANPSTSEVWPLLLLTIYITNIQLKGEQGELQIYFRKISLHQQKFLVVSVFSNSLWLLENLKNVQNEVTKHFSVGNTFRQVTMHARIFCIYYTMT